MNKFEKMVAEVPGLTSSEAFVLYRLANHADISGKCWPSIRTLSSETRLDQRTIYYTLKSLEARNIIIRYPARGRSTLYALNFNNVLERVAEENRDRWGRSHNKKEFDRGRTEELEELGIAEELRPEYEKYRSRALERYPGLTEESIIEMFMKMWKKKQKQGSVTA